MIKRILQDLESRTRHKFTETIIYHQEWKLYSIIIDVMSFENSKLKIKSTENEPWRRLPHEKDIANLFQNDDCGE